MEQARELALLSRSIGRQIGLLIDRGGRVRMVIAGTPGGIYIPELPAMASGSGKLRGLRLLHTHLDPGGLNQEDLMDLLFLRLDGMQSLVVSPAGEPVCWQGAWLAPPGHKSDPYAVGQTRNWADIQCDFASRIDDYERRAASLPEETGDASQNALLISVSTEPQRIQDRNLDELASLSHTAGLRVAGRLRQRVANPNPKHILGKGKLAELETMALGVNAGILIFDGELTPAQLHNLADITERRVIDRTQLILDIFARRAVSRAGKLQVELAQLAYAQPRLTGSHKALDRLMGGIGGRGPGESRLETDRRKVRERMAFLKRELDKIRRQRAFVRQRRQRNGIPVVAIVGYTNAGKSTLLNSLTRSGVLTEDKLFATLDTATRRLRFPCQREITISDTVGFIRNLPAELKSAFMATLEELRAADMLVHVVDASSPELQLQMRAVEDILEDLLAPEFPCLLVFNKADALDEQKRMELAADWPDAIFVSAREKQGLDRLLAALERELFLQRLLNNVDAGNGREMRPEKF